MTTVLASTLDGAAGPAGLRIGEWRANPATNELTREGASVRLEPKVMDVLVRLAQRPGEVVTRDELFDAVWPGVVVGDEALTQSIIKLRRALGDDSRAPSYIETISKRGYRLIAPVQPDAEPTHVPTRRRPWALAGVVAGVLAVAAVALHFARAPPAPDAAEAKEPWIGVAVLPFTAAGSGDAQAHLAHGIGESLMTDLGRLADLRVIRASGTAPAGARYVVSGTVQREGAVLRVHVHLVDTRTGEQLWSERIERPYGDLFAVQDELTRKVLEFLPAKVGEAERQRLARPYTRNLEAYDWFLRAQARFLVRRAEDNDEARAAYRKALELDPAFARAYAGLAMTYAMDHRLRDPAASATLARAFELAETARQLDPDIAEVHWALGFVHAQSRRHDEAVRSLTRAIELDRSYADAYALLAGVYTYQGEPAKSLPLVRTAMRLNPQGGYLYFVVAGRAHLFANDPEQALLNLRAANLRNPSDVETRAYLAAALVATGDRAAARWEADEIRALAPGFTAREWLATYPMTDAAQRQRLLELLAAVEL